MASVSSVCCPGISEAVSACLCRVCIGVTSEAVHSGKALRQLYNLLQFQKLWLDMEMSDRMLPLKVGLDASGSGSAFITRNLVSSYRLCLSMLDVMATYAVPQAAF